MADVPEAGALKMIAELTATPHVGLFFGSARFGTSKVFSGSRIDEEVNVLRVNYAALQVLTQHFAKMFAEPRRGSIILFS